MRIFLDPIRAEQFKDSLREPLRDDRLINYIKVKCDKKVRGGQVLTLPGEVGHSKIVENPNEVYWGYRRGRPLPSRLTTELGEVTSDISVIGFPNKFNPRSSYFIKILFTGDSTGQPELRSFNPRNWDQERFFSSIHYWGSHAITQHREHVQAPMSNSLEELFQEAFQTGNLTAAREFQRVLLESERYLQ